jgi:hypothetical protein
LLQQKAEASHGPITGFGYVGSPSYASPFSYHGIFYLKRNSHETERNGKSPDLPDRNRIRNARPSSMEMLFLMER